MTLQQFGVSNDRTLRLIEYGRGGVDLFFALSGFLICGRLLREFRTTGGVSLKSFYVRRVFRILPLYFAYLALISALAVFAALPVSQREIISCLVFLRNYTSFGHITLEGGMGYTVHLWSLSVEEHFYLIWPLFLVLLTPRRALWITPVLAILVQSWRSLDAKLNLFNTYIVQVPPEFRTDTKIDGLFWGCFAALLLDRYPQLKMPRGSPVFVLIALVIAAIHPSPIRHMLLGMLLALLVVSTVKSPQSPISRVLELPPIRWVGRLSYSLYIVQGLFFQYSSSDPAWILSLKSFPISFLGTFALAVASHYLLEQPMIRLGRSLLKRKPGVVVN